MRTSPHHHSSRPPCYLPNQWLPSLIGDEHAPPKTLVVGPVTPSRACAADGGVLGGEADSEEPSTEAQMEEQLERQRWKPRPQRRELAEAPKQESGIGQAVRSLLGAAGVRGSGRVSLMFSSFPDLQDLLILAHFTFSLFLTLKTGFLLHIPG